MQQYLTTKLHQNLLQTFQTNNSIREKQNNPLLGTLLTEVTTEYDWKDLPTKVRVREELVREEFVWEELVRGELVRKDLLPEELFREDFIQGIIIRKDSVEFDLVCGIT